MEASRKAPRVTNETEKEGDDALDAELWGKLQEHIPLQTVYEKLSQQDLFRLRFVCKAWHHVALQRLLPKPSFVTITTGDDPCEPRFLNGIVTYDVTSGRFNFKRQRFRLINVDSHVPPFETEGLVLCHNPDDLKQRGVFNVHTQTWHVIPPAPQKCKSLSACGLMVDTTLKPYTFKLIEGNADINTQIYDSKSRSWSTTSSRLLQAAAKMSRLYTFEYICICNNGHVYMSLGRFKILKYSMQDDLWTTLKFPRVKRESEDTPPPDNSLGVWEGRIFTTRENYQKKRVTVWELVDPEKQEWVEYAHSTKKQYGWLWECDFAHNGPCIYEEMCLRSFFRDGYLLVCCWRWSSARADALVLFNMATKTWKKVGLRMGTVAIDEQEPVAGEKFHECEDENGEDVEADEDEDEDGDSDEGEDGDSEEDDDGETEEEEDEE